MHRKTIDIFKTQIRYKINIYFRKIRIKSILKPLKFKFNSNTFIRIHLLESRRHRTSLQFTHNPQTIDVRVTFIWHSFVRKCHIYISKMRDPPAGHCKAGGNLCICRVYRIFRNRICKFVESFRIRYGIDVKFREMFPVKGLLCCSTLPSHVCYITFYFIYFRWIWSYFILERHYFFLTIYKSFFRVVRIISILSTFTGYNYYALKKNWTIIRWLCI